MTDEVGVELECVSGECKLSLTSGSLHVVVKNHWINARLSDLTDAVVMLTQGCEIAACRWPGPVHEGHFIDLARDPAGGVSVAVAQYRKSDASRIEEIWDARRGDVVFAAHAQWPDFVMTFTQALRIMRNRRVEPNGLIREYPRAFPQDALEKLERYAARLGYYPLSSAD